MHPKQLSKIQCAGQRMMVGFDGTQVDDTLRHYIDRLAVGGIILFARNLSSPGQMADLCESAQAYASQCGHPPLLIGIDQEGGVVSRLKPPFTQFEGQPSIRNSDDAIHFAQTTARELAQVGVNMNMSPVLDVLPRQGESVMQDRAFGSDPEHVANLGLELIKTFQENRIMAVAKHFPGIGRTVLDSHHELPDLETEAASLDRKDVLPFRRAIDADVAGIMLSHIRYRAVDPQWPASLSTAIAGDILRNKLGYQGVTLTDDLDMGAIAKHYTPEVVVSRCLAATIDILLVCHPGEKIDAMHRYLMHSLDHDEQMAADGFASLTRIQHLKNTYLTAYGQ